MISSFNFGLKNQSFIFLLLAYFILTPECRNSKNHAYTVELKASDKRIDLQLCPDSRNLVFMHDSFVWNDSSFFACYNERGNKVEIYNLEKGVLSASIQFQTEGPDAIIGIADFIMQTPDTIYTINFGTKEIACVSHDGSIFKRISILEDIEGRKIQPVFYEEGLKNFIIDGNIYLGQEYRLANMSSLSQDLLEKTRVNVLVNTRLGDCFSSTLTYPVELLGRDVSGMKVYRDIAFDNGFIYHFGQLNSLYLTKDHISFRKVPLRIEYDLQFPQENQDILSKGFEKYYDYYLQHDELLNIYFDKYRCYYYLVVRVRGRGIEKGKDFSMQFMYPKCMIIVLDRNLNSLGEFLLPDDKYSCQVMFVAPDGLYISEDHPNNPDFDEDFMRFRLFKLEKQ